MKAHGIYQSNSRTRETAIPSPKRKELPAENAAGPSTKRRKVGKEDQYTETSLNTDDDEGLFTIKAEASSATPKEERATFKEELPTIAESSALTHCLSPEPTRLTFVVDEASFNPFFPVHAQSELVQAAPVVPGVSAPLRLIRSPKSVMRAFRVEVPQERCLVILVLKSKE